MFEHFGIRDIFSTIKRYRNIIFAILLITVILGGMSGISNVKAAKASIDNPTESFYICTASYSIDPKIKATDTNLSAYNAIPSQIAAGLNADFSQKYVYEKLMEKCTPQELISKTILSKEPPLNIEELNMHYLNKIFKAKQYQNSMIIQLYVETYDSNFSNQIISIYNDYLINLYALSNPNVKISYMDTVNSTIPTSVGVIKLLNEMDKDKDKTLNIVQSNYTVNAKKIILKSVLIPIVIVSVLLCLVVFIVSLLNPTLNRRTDFFEYELPVTGNLYIAKFKNRRR